MILTLFSNRMFPALMLACTVLPSAGSPRVVAAERPNIVLLLADDLGWTGLNCFGSDFYETPHLDRLAAQGMKFTNAYSACTVCSPTRASLMTGQYPARLRLTDFIAGQNRPFAKMRIPDWTPRLRSEEITIAECLKDAGYRTGHIGKWHLNGKAGHSEGTFPKDQGFDVSIGRPPGTKGYLLKPGTRSESGSNYLTDWLTDRACEFLRSSADQPFFLYFAYNVPHTPIVGRDDLVKKFKAKVGPDAIHHNPTYAAMVASLDDSVGRVMNTLDQLGQADNTLIIFTSDNGGLTQRYGVHDDFTENLPLRRGKGSAYEGGVRVPAIARLPGVIPPASVCDEPVMTIDYLPTFCKAIGTVLPENTDIDGVSLWGLMQQPAKELDRNLYWHYPHYHAGGDGPYSAIRSGDYRLIEFHEDQSIRLYNLATDLGEQNDLADKRPAIAKALHKQLVRWREKVDAQMPTPNPDYDPKRETEVRRGRKVSAGK